MRKCKTLSIWRWVLAGVMFLVCLVVLAGSIIVFSISTGQVVFIKAQGFYPNYEIIVFKYSNFVIYKDIFKTEYVQINKSFRKNIFQVAEQVSSGDEIKAWGLLDGTTFGVYYKGAVQSIDVGGLSFIHELESDGIPSRPIPEDFDKKYILMESLYNRVNVFIEISQLNEFQID